MIPQAVLAEYLLKQQPATLRRLLMRDHDFLRQVGLTSRTIIKLADQIEIDRIALIETIRRSLKNKRPQTIAASNGRSITVVPKKSGVSITSKAQGPNEKAVRVEMPEMLVLSPNRKMRAHALQSFIRRAGPPYLEFRDLRASITKRGLSNEEIGFLLDKSIRSLAAVQSRISISLRNGKANAATLIPDELSYYEQFCGPNPIDVKIEDYLKNILPEYRKNVLDEDFERGLQICLLGGLRDDLSPGPWTENITDNKMWSALEKCSPSLDPFSLLGALDIALFRQHDNRFKKFSDDVVIALTKPKLLRADGTDVYELLAALAELVTNQINCIENGALRPAFWKRMCAWMQSNLLIHLMARTAIDMSSFRKWCGENETTAGTYASMMDLREEPMFHAAYVSATALRGEVLGRLLGIQARHALAGRKCPRDAEIKEAIKVFATVRPLGWIFPGPLEGHIRPSTQKGRELPEADEQRLIKRIHTNGGRRAWDSLAYLSQLFSFSDKLKAQLRAAIEKIRVSLTEKKRKETAELLGNASLVAGALRDENLARSIAACIVAHASKAQSNEQVTKLFRAVLLAGSAFEDKAEWAKWLKEMLASLALALPSGQPSEHLSVHLNELEKAFPLSLHLTKPASFVARSGF